MSMYDHMQEYANLAIYFSAIAINLGYGFNRLPPPFTRLYRQLDPK